MKPFDPPLHKSYLDDEAGLNKLVAEEIAESKWIDFKLTYNRREPTYGDTARVDCASLASAGEGYLVVGVDESRDGRSVATAVVGVPIAEATVLMQSIEQLVAARISPPIDLQAARLVALASGNQVVVVHLKGRANYPVTVDLSEGEGRTVSYLREGRNNKQLSAKEAELARQTADLPARKAHPLMVTGVILAITLSVALPLLLRGKQAAPGGPVATSAQGTRAPSTPAIESLPPTSRPPPVLNSALGEGLTLLRTKKLDAAESAVNRAEAMAPTWYGALLLARIDMERGEPARATELLKLAETRYFDLLTRVDPAARGRTPKDLLAGMQRDTEAHADVVLWISDPQLSLIYDNLSASLTDSGRPQEAEAVARMALSIAPKDSIALSNLGASLRTQGKWPEAQEVFARVLQLEPNDPSTRTNLGEVLRALGQRDESKKQFDRALAADPKFGPAWAGVGELAMDANDNASAVDAFSRARVLAPLDGSARNNLCLVLGRQSQWKEAIAACEEATRVDPANAKFWINLGFTLFDARALDVHNLERSCDAMGRALNLDSNAPQAHLGQGNCLSASGREEDARLAYAEFLRLAERSGCCQPARDFVEKKLKAQ